MSRRAAREPTVLTRAEARRWLIGHLGLAQLQPLPGAAGVRALLQELRCIQLDPLDPMGTNADLVALARVDGIARGDVYRHLLPGHAFEHYAKERCLRRRFRTTATAPRAGATGGATRSGCAACRRAC